MPPFNRALPTRKHPLAAFRSTECPAFGLGGNVDRAAWDEAVAALRGFNGCMERFLLLWAEYMKLAGYLAFTTAKRQDCIKSALLLLEPVLEQHEQGKYPNFEDLIGNIDGWADDLLESGLRHWRRGISVAMFLGCFKTFIWAMQDALDDLGEGPPGPSGVEKAKKLLGLYGHAFEIIWVEAALTEPLRDSARGHEAVNRLLTLEKCRFENVFNTTSDGVLVMDQDCRITNANATLARYAGEGLRGRFIWEALGLEGIGGKEELFAAFPLGTQLEAPLFNGSLFFRIGIVSLGQVSLAHRHEYIACLSNVTHLVRQRELLKAEVDKRTAELLREKKQLEEMNITLRNVIKSANEEREKSLEDLSREIRRFVLPALRKVLAEDERAARETYARLLTEQLERLLSPAQGVMGRMGLDEPAETRAGLGKLTLTELKVCQLVQAGHSSKTIAELLAVSPETVKTHRRSIRRKLNLRGSEAQLGAFLLNLQF